MIEDTKTGRFWREPLVHFLLIGLLVFGGHALWSARLADEGRTISVSAAQLDRLTTLWANETGREPSTEDVKAVLDDYVREEVLYREALKLGLERDDTIIRRRLAQKMGFLVQRDDLVEPLSEAELRAAYEAAPEAYRRPSRLSFVHVPFNFTTDGANRTDEMEAALGLLQSGAGDAATLGDPFLLARRHVDLAEPELARLFGRVFAAELFTQEEGVWIGPVRSRLADHLIRVDARTGADIPPFEQIIEEVRTRESARRRQAENDAAMARLMEGYRVILNGSPG